VTDDVVMLVGAASVVGEAVLEELADRGRPVGQLRLVDDGRSLPVEPLDGFPFFAIDGSRARYRCPRLRRGAGYRFVLSTERFHGLIRA